MSGLTHKQKDELRYAQRLFDRLAIEPTDVEPADRPDIRFSFEGKRIGLEVTLGDSEEYLRVQSMKMSGEITGVTHPVGLHDDRKERRSKQEVQTEALTPKWEDASILDKRWAEKVKGAYETKLGKLNHPDFARFNEDWLLITGFEGPANDVVSLRESPKHLAAELSSVHPVDNGFDRVYIHFDDYLFSYINGELAVSNRVEEGT